MFFTEPRIVRFVNRMRKWVRESGMGVCSAITTDLNLSLQLCFINKSQKMGLGFPGFIECLPRSQQLGTLFPIQPLFYMFIFLTGTSREEGWVGWLRHQDLSGRLYSIVQCEHAIKGDVSAHPDSGGQWGLGKAAQRFNSSSRFPPALFLYQYRATRPLPGYNTACSLCQGSSLMSHVY